MLIRYFVIFLVVIIFAGPLFAASDGNLSDQSKTLLKLFVIDGGPIVWYVLMPMSVLMVSVAVMLCFSFRRNSIFPKDITESIAREAAGLKPADLAARLSKNDDLISKVMVRVLVKSEHFDADKKYTQELAKESLYEQAVVMLRKVEWCGILGNVAPMVGLFGTVYGMIQAFDILGVAEGQPPSDQLAAKISIALVTTFWGLLIAIPSLLIHGIFRSRIEAIVSEAAVEIDMLLMKILGSNK